MRASLIPVLLGPSGMPLDGIVTGHRLLFPNLLQWSEAYDTVWAKTRCYVAANCAANPITGAYTVDKIVEDGTATLTHQFRQDTTPQAVPHMLMFRVKAGGRDWVRLYSWGTAGGYKSVYFNLTGAGIKGVESGAVGSIQRVGTSDFYDCFALITPAAELTQWHCDPSAIDGNQTYSGLGHQGVCAAGGSVTTAVLAAGASAVDDIYTHYFSAAAANKNLVWPKSASDFSYGSLSNWTVTGAGASASDAVNGVNAGPCIKIDSTAADGGGSSPAVGTLATWRVTAGSIYSFSGSLKGAIGGETYRLGVIWYDFSGVAIGSAINSGTLNLTNVHARYVLENLTAPVGATQVRLLVRQVGAGTLTCYGDEFQFEQAAAATAYVAPTQGALWSNAGSKPIFSDAPTVEHNGTAYNGSTKVLTFTPARASAPNGTTYTVGPGIYVARAQLYPAATLPDYAATTDLQSLAGAYGTAYALQRGSAVGADTNDFTPLGPGASFDGTDYGKTPELSSAIGGFCVVFKPTAAITPASGLSTLMALAIGNAVYLGPSSGVYADEIITVISRNDGIYRYHYWADAAGSISNTAYHMLIGVLSGDTWKLYLDGVELPVVAYGTGVSPITATEVRFGATLTGTSAFDGQILSGFTWSRPMSASEVVRIRRAEKAFWAPWGVTL